MSAARPRRVLIVDDVSDIRLLLRIALEEHGRLTVVAEAGDGFEAIEQARLHGPDLVVLDLSMPNLDGLEALPGILAAAPEARVVVLSGFDARAMAEAALAAGAAAYFEKGDLLAFALQLENIA